MLMLTCIPFPGSPGPSSSFQLKIINMEYVCARVSVCVYLRILGLSRVYTACRE